MLDTITYKIFDAVQKSPSGIITIDILRSLELCSSSTLKTILSRLNKAKKIINLKRGTYSVYPLQDAFIAAQTTFNGYLGLSTALYIHNLATEVPFTIFIITPDTSESKVFGNYEFKAIALKKKAVGLQRKGKYVISTKAKTLFDCIYLSRYSIEEEKLIEIFQEHPLTKKEWKEFDEYVKRFIKSKMQKRFYQIKNKILA